MTIEEIEKEWLTAKVWAESGTMTGEMMSQKELAEWADKFGPKLIAVAKAAKAVESNPTVDYVILLIKVLEDLEG